jgi:hypothetical protein
MKLSIVIMLVATITLSCEANKESVEFTSNNNNAEIENQEAENPEELELDESLIVSIDSYRQRLENEIENPIELKSVELREKAKQKWKKIHFYIQEGNVVRIKSYPHEGISERTEEFYLKDGELVLAVIEDHGLTERLKETEEFDKVYYFDKGDVIKEIGAEKETEYAVKNSDGEELLSEVKEYLKVYSDKIQKME